MIHSVKDPSPDQRHAVESLLGHPVSEEEQVSVRTIPVPPAPEWLRSIQRDAREKGLDRLTAEEIDAEIAAARRAASSGADLAHRTISEVNPDSMKVVCGGAL